MTTHCSMKKGAIAFNVAADWTKVDPGLTPYRTGCTLGHWCKQVLAGWPVSMKSKVVAWHLQRIYQAQVEALGVTVMRQSDGADRMQRLKRTPRTEASSNGSNSNISGSSSGGGT